MSLGQPHISFFLKLDMVVKQGQEGRRFIKKKKRGKKLTSVFVKALWLNFACPLLHPQLAIASLL